MHPRLTAFYVPLRVMPWEGELGVEQAGETVFQLNLRQEALRERGGVSRPVGGIALQQELGSIENELLRRGAGMDRKQLEAGALIVVELEFHRVTLACAVARFKESVVTRRSDWRE